MKPLPLLLALIALLALGFAPARAQDGCGCGDDDESVLEGDDEGCSEMEEGEPEFEEDGRNSAGQKKYKKKGDGSDEGAPKLKRSLQERVNQAIADGIVALKKMQKGDGQWGAVVGHPYGNRKGKEFAAHFSGPTSFAVFTLSKCGVKKSDKSVKKGYRWLKKHYRQSQFWNSKGPSTAKSGRVGGNMGTYEVASLILMLEAMHEQSAKLTGKHSKRPLQTDNPRKPPKGSKFPKDDWLWLHEAVTVLHNGKLGGRGKQIRGYQNVAGGWRYGQANADQDMSATQFALLGMRAASRAGYPLKPRVWKWALDGVKKQLGSDGSFGYKAGMPWSASMDACGLGSMVICKEQLELANSLPYGWVDGAIERTAKHLDSVFDVQHNKGDHGGGSYHFYYLYSVERVGDLTGRKEFGGKDWYVRGAEFLLAQQHAGGGWTDSTCIKPKDVLGTCFALLFLKKATIPAVTLSE